MAPASCGHVGVCKDLRNQPSASIIVPNWPTATAVKADQPEPQIETSNGEWQVRTLHRVSHAIFVLAERGQEQHPASAKAASCVHQSRRPAKSLKPASDNQPAPHCSKLARSDHEAGPVTT